MAKSHLKLVAPATKNRTVTPKRPPNADLRADLPATTSSQQTSAQPSCSPQP